MYLHSERPSDTRPEMAMPIWSSILKTLCREELSSELARFSVATTTQLLLCIQPHLNNQLRLKQRFLK